ncbi:MAG: TetR/AcrR family transcriptional regulator [Thermodesulfobacteriota bacterium]
MAKREEILEAATMLFYEKGYQSTSMNDLANEMGLSKSAIYHYFRSKEEILVEIYEKTITDATNELSKLATSDKSTIDKLREAIINQIEHIMIERQSMLKIFFQEEEQLPDKFHKSIKKRKREYNRLIEGIFTEGISEGIFKKGDPQLFVNAFLGMCLWVYRWYKPNSKYKPEDISKYFVKLIEEGCLTPDFKRLTKETVTTPSNGEDISGGDFSVESVIKRMRYHTSMIEILNSQLNTLLEEKIIQH